MKLEFVKHEERIHVIMSTNGNTVLSHCFFCGKSRLGNLHRHLCNECSRKYLGDIHSSWEAAKEKFPELKS